MVHDPPMNHKRMLSRIAKLHLILHPVWRVARPTLVPALLKNRRIPEDTSAGEEGAWRDRLRECDPNDLTSALSTLLIMYESDHDRIRGMEAKAIGVLQIAGLIFAGDVAALTFALRQNASHTTFVIALLLWSAVYLLSVLTASSMVMIPKRRYLLSVDEALPPDLTATKLVMYMKLNARTNAIVSNLTTASASDAVRAFVVTVVALIAAVPTT